MTALREIFARFTTQFDDKDLKKGKESTNAATDALQKLKKELVAAAGVGAIGLFIQGAARAGGEIAKTANVLGISTEQLQAYALLARQAGRETDDVTDAISTLQERARDAFNDPKSDPAEQFRLLGISATDASGELKSANELFREVSDGFAGMTNQTDRVGAAMTLFGDVGRELLPVLQQGSQAFDLAEARLEALGGGFDDNGTAAAAAFTQIISDAGTVLNGFRSIVLTVVVPALGWIFDQFRRVAVPVIRFLKQAENMELALKTLGTAAALFGSQFLGAWLKALLPVAVGIVAVVAGGVLLFAIIQDLQNLVTGGPSLFRDYTDALEDFFDLNRNGTGVIARLSQAWEYLVGLVEQGFAAVGSLFGFSGGNDDLTAERGLPAPGSDAARGSVAQDLRDISAQSRLRPVGLSTAAQTRVPGSGNREGASVNLTQNNTIQNSGLSDTEFTRRVRNEIEGLNENMIREGVAQFSNVEDS